MVPRLLPLLTAALALSACDGPDRVVAIGVPVRHDDFDYSVERAARVSVIGGIPAHGTFQLVTVQVANHAARVAHAWSNDLAYMVDDQGRVFENDVNAQARLARSQAFDLSDRHVTAAGATSSSVFVFDIPDDAGAGYVKFRGDWLMGDVVNRKLFARTRVRIF
jgi:hypothetical protein